MTIGPSVVMCASSFSDVFFKEIGLRPSRPFHSSPSRFILCVFRKQLGTQPQHFAPACSSTLISSQPSTGVTVHTAAVHTQRDKNGRRDFHAENQEYYKKKEITNAMLVGAAIPAVVTCAASWQLAMSAEATAAWFMSAAGITEQMEILNMEYST